MIDFDALFSRFNLCKSRGKKLLSIVRIIFAQSKNLILKDKKMELFLDL